MNSLIVIGVLLFAHWIGDFVLQTDKQAKEKSTKFTSLLEHTLTYGLVMLITCHILYVSNIFGAQYSWTPYVFAGVQFITHTIIDYFTSKFNSKLWKEGKVHYFFVSIGFDQFLHLLIMFWTITELYY